MRIGMIAARFAGLDGVSLEAAKLAEALERPGHEVFWFAGELGPEFAPGVAFAPASFGADANMDLQRLAFSSRDAVSVRTEIAATAAMIEDAIEAFLDRYHVEAVIVENAWAIPMHLPLAVAISNVVKERDIPTVGHHHDFAWERPRFDECVVPEILEEYFPPSGGRISHLVINTIAAQELQSRRGLSSTVLPNVMDFEAGDLPSDGGKRLRQLAGIETADVVLLQPTRVIRRKGIELTVELASRLVGDPKVIITHPDDLDVEYWADLQKLAIGLGVDLRLVDAGRDRHALVSAYAAADLVCFPSHYEGYGNALVEAVYYRRPLMVNRYAVYNRDIAPLGFDFLELDGVVTEEAVAVASDIISGGESIGSTVDRNYGIGLRNLSYTRAVENVEACFSRVM